MKSVADGAKDGVAAVPGAKLNYLGPPQPNPTTQSKMFRDVLSRKPDGVAIMPLQASLWVRALRDAESTGIPLIAFNEAAPKGAPVKTFVGINDREAADALLDTLKKKIGDTRGKIVLGNCIPGVATLDFRIRAFKQGIAKRFPRASVKGPFQTTTEPAENFSNWQRTMSANRDAVAFIGNCDSDGPGLIKAKRETGVKGETLTFDINLETLRGIKDGRMLAALGEAPYVRGYITMRLLAEAARDGEAVPEGFVNIRGELVTRGNVDEVLTREASLEATRRGFRPYLDDFFKNPAAKMEPLENVYN
jgi:ribose transport system substrate-binding protein